MVGRWPTRVPLYRCLRRRFRSNIARWILCCLCLVGKYYQNVLSPRKELLIYLCALLMIGKARFDYECTLQF